MKKKKRLKIVLFLLIITTSSCQEKKEVRENLINNNNIVMKVLEKQLKQGANQYINLDDGGNVEIPKKKFEVEDFNAMVIVVKDVLNSNAYKKPDNETFVKKVKEIFGRVIVFNSEKKYLYINYFDKCDKIFNNNPNNGVDFNGTYIVKGDNFISDFYYVPEIVDYTKVFPQLANMESNLPQEYSENGRIYSIESWKSLENREEKEYKLSISHKKNINILINRNKYLFNDNKASLVWLKFNDEYFLESLIKIFGYVKDNDLLKWVVENNRFKTKSGSTNGEEYGQLLWHKTCDGKFIFHKETIEIMKEGMKVSDGNYMDDLLDYIRYLEDEKSLKFEEKMIIVANVLHLSSFLAQDSSYERYRYSMGSYYKFSDAKSKISIDKEFKKNNYYDLPNMNVFWEEAKVDGDGVSYPGQE